MKKILYIDINKSCNNNCIGCAIDPNIHKNKYRDLGIIKKELRKGIEQGYKILHMVGGEPTLHPNLLKIIKSAKGLGYKTVITSNGRMFSYKNYTIKFRRLVSSFSITLFGSNEKTYESWTRTPGSFKQAVSGLKNLLDTNQNVCLNIPIWSGNINQLEEYIALIKKLKIKELGVLMLGPFGRLKSSYNKHNPSLISLHSLNRFLRVAKGVVDSIDVEDFPLCIFDQDVLEAEKIHFQDISSSVYTVDDGRIETLGLFAAHEKGYKINTLELNKKNYEKLKKDINSFKQKLDECKSCSMSGECKGIYNQYLDRREDVSRELFKLFKICNRVPTLVLNVTYKCNLNCKYCPTIKKRESMSFEIAKKNLDILLTQNASFYLCKFFGGEPLVEWDVIKKIIDYATLKQKNIKFSLTTNVVLLNKDIIEYLKSNDVELIVSIDGTSKWQELNRGKQARDVLNRIGDYFNYVTLNMVVAENNFRAFFENFQYLYQKVFRKFNFLPAFFTEWNDKSFDIVKKEMGKIIEYLKKEVEI